MTVTLHSHTTDSCQGKTLARFTAVIDCWLELRSCTIYQSRDGRVRVGLPSFRIAGGDMFRCVGCVDPAAEVELLTEITQAAIDGGYIAEVDVAWPRV